MRLPRLHLFEFLDQPWLPSTLRRYLTDYLSDVQHRFGFDTVMAEKLAEVVAAHPEYAIVDLGSGAGGPILGLRRLLLERGLQPEFLLTDLHPEPETLTRFAPGNGVRYHPIAVDARRVPAELQGTRTLINALHHLRPEQVRALFADAAAKQQPLVTFDVVQRSLSGVLSMLLVPLITWTITPFLRPFRWSRLVLTYPLPVIPLLATWDGLVSQLRGYSPDELLSLGTPTPGYQIESGMLGDRRRRVTYLIGRPVAARTEVPLPESDLPAPAKIAMLST